MIRTERTKARERRRTTRSNSARTPTRRSRPSRPSTLGEARRGADTRWWEDVAEGDSVGPMVKGPLTVTDMVCWHVGMGMGLYGVKPLRLGAQKPQAHPPVLPPHDLNIPDVMQRVHWDPEVRPSGRVTRPRSTTGGCVRRG